ncbi:MAG: hypothetical protein KBE41_11060 [Lutibacter sp.]|nr:hypothetical protein [Lutibacter sp.]MBP9602035.1 hypothetical protein [Lutibacter sp.]
MTTIFIIIAAIIITALIAYAVVNFIPKKLHWIISTVLILIAAFLVYKINFEIQKPMSFNKEKIVKYRAVINQLKIIRDAEVAYKKVNGKYSDKPEELIAFIENGKFALTQTRNVVKTINVGGGITKEVEERVVDTIGHEDVIKYFANKDYKNMMNIPGTDQKFKIELGTVERVSGSGLYAPVFEVKVDKALILAGMDDNLVKQEKEAIGGEDIRGEYVRIGSLGEVSEDGNWPPFYDQGDKKVDEE